MQPTQTGIAVALALGVVVLIFVLGGVSPFGPTAVAPAPEDAITAQLASTTKPTTMPNQPAKNMNVNATTLQVQDEIVGTGAAAAPGDKVTVNYVGSLTNGTVFDASANHGTTGFDFTLGAGQVIKGWDQGIVGMKVGGKRILVIPADLAYGSQAVGNVIPANSTLLFEVELLKVEKPH